MGPQARRPCRGSWAVHPIDTALPGLKLTNLLPQTAKIADKIAVVRSMTHNFNNHIAGTYVMLTGSMCSPTPIARPLRMMLQGRGDRQLPERGRGGVPAAVSLPTWLSIPGPSNRMPGQYAGYLGATHDPFLIQGEPHKPDFKPLSLTLPEKFRWLGLSRARSCWDRSTP